MKRDPRDAVLWLWLAPALAQPAAAAEVCVPNPSTGPDVCVGYLEGTPVRGADFEVDFADPSDPVVTLRTGSTTWNVRSVDPDGSAGDIGSLRLDPAEASDDFEVSLWGEAGEPGATRAGNIDLTAPGWTGHSSIVGGEVSQNVGGLMLAQDPSGRGGEVIGLTVGDVVGDVTIPVVRSLLVFGGIKAGQFTVADRLEGSLEITGQVFAGITIAAFTSGELLLSNPKLEFFGTLDLPGGIPDPPHPALIARVRIFLDLAGGATIDLHGKGVAGSLECFGANAGSIVNGGPVTGLVTLARGAGNAFSGTAEFASVSPTGVVNTVEAADATGIVRVGGRMAGTLAVGGALGPGARITVDDPCDGDVAIGRQTTARSLIALHGGLGAGGTVRINTSQGDHDAGGLIVIGRRFAPLPSLFDGCIRVHDDRRSSEGGNLLGSITVIGCHASPDDLNICIDGEDHGHVRIQQDTCAIGVTHSCSRCP